MTDMFRRACVVYVDDLKVEGLRCTFKAVKTLKKDPNTLDLVIYNLAPGTRAAMRERGARVLLLAGFEGEVSQVFSGDARTTTHRHERPEWVTHIQCGDGEVAYQFDRISESFAPGTRLVDVVAAACRAMRVDSRSALAKLRSLPPAGELDQFSSGYAAHGQASAVLDSLLRTRGLSWSIQDGRLQVLAPGEVLPGQVVLLSAATGLIGSPDHGTPDAKGGPSTLKVRCLLNPQLRCGGLVRVQGEAVSGQFRVQRLEHSGDTAGAGWYSDLEVTAA